MGFTPTLQVSTTTPIDLTAGSILFSDGSAIAQDNTNFFWNDANNRLGIGTNTPEQTFHVFASTVYKGIFVNGNAAPNISFAQNGNTAAEWKVGISGNTGSSFSISSGTTATDRFTINSLGNSIFGGKIAATTTETIDIYTFGGSNKYGLGVNSAKTTLFYNSAASGLSFGSWDGTTYVEKLGIDTNGIVTFKNASPFKTSVTLTNGAAAATGTLTNAPTAGNPTKWIPIVDNGTTRYIPAW
jgi:hypothetical protein